MFANDHKTIVRTAENSYIKNQSQNCVQFAYLVLIISQFIQNKLHCLICDCVVKYANTATRLRRICGNCLRSILQLINQCPLYTKDFANLNKSNINKINAKK